MAKDYTVLELYISTVVNITYIFSNYSIFLSQWCALRVCELCTCSIMGLRNRPICRWWRGCAEVVKTTYSQANGHYGKTRRTLLSENSARLIRTVLLSSDIEFICVWLGKWSFFIQILKAV